MFSYAGAPWRFLNLIPSPTPSHPLHTLQCEVKGDLAPCLIICIHHLSNVSISSDSTVLVSLVKIGQNKQLDYELMFSLSSSSIRDWQGNKAKSFFSGLSNHLSQLFLFDLFWFYRHFYSGGYEQRPKSWTSWVNFHSFHPLQCEVKGDIAPCSLICITEFHNSRI